ncbi:Acetyltransferase (GNAT) domain-containing protein [Devosia sp. YR412]|uniref:GNAT family N-acetyltransferase n=1 Tax=Devosia sp. YR412 TaxID=1881030 RepID=UPI0008C6B6EE|nr:GNAT family N-acetyltransferase [Devosia sp. YR412]SEQ25151.1 Acetyltransferase (GNAT) domain-containing protein [Devosia sp. YR412]
MSETAMESARKVQALTPFAAILPPVLPLDQVSRPAWDDLVASSIEPNAFYAPSYALPAFGLSKTRALVAHAGQMLIGLLPVASGWSVLRLPLPVLVAHQPYSPLTVPLLSDAHAEAAAGALIDAAAASGARVLSLPLMMLEGPAYAALSAAMAQRGIVPTIHNRYQRAAQDATQGAETYLRNGLGSKRLKDFRRLRNRLDEEGAVSFTVHTDRADVVAALDRFLVLEALGWKGAGGTGLGQSDNDACFVRAAATAGAFEIAELMLDERLIASGIIMRQGDRAFFFKIAYDETLSRYSPGVQLTLELTRLFAADPTLKLVDSTADAGHPMIDHVWRERLALGDLLIPTHPNDPIAAAIIKLMAFRRGLRSRLKTLWLRIKTFKENRT